MVFHKPRHAERQREAADDFFEMPEPGRRRLAWLASLSIVMALGVAILAIGQISPDIDRSHTSSIIRDTPALNAPGGRPARIQPLESTLPSTR